MEELIPCAHCGGKAIITKRLESDPPYSYTVIYAYCCECGIQTPKKIADGYYGERWTPEQVAQMWNRRVKTK